MTTASSGRLSALPMSGTDVDRLANTISSSTGMARKNSTMTAAGQRIQT